MVVGAMLLMLQVYLLGVAWVHVANGMSWAAGLLLAVVVVIIGLQVMWVAAHRGPAVRWKNYPATFAGLVVTGFLLAPLLLGGI